MGARLLLPGYGGKFETPTLDSTSDEETSDTLDVSRCASFAVQVEEVSTASGTIFLEHSFDGENWAPFGTAIDAGDDAKVYLYGIDKGPFGRIRFNPSIVSGSAKVSVVGYQLPVGA